MARPPLSRLYAPRTLAFAAASGVVELVPFHRARGCARAAIIAAPGLAYAGTVAWATTRRGSAALQRTAPEIAVPGKINGQLIGVTAAISLVLSGGTAASLVLDGASERLLVRRGVSNPRLVMAAAGALLGWITEYLDTGETACDDRSGDEEQPDGDPVAGEAAGVEARHRDDERPVDAPPRA